MNRAAVRLSLRHGHGDLHWFDKLSREDRALIVAFELLDRDPKAGERKPSGADLLATHLARIERKKAAQS